MELSGTEQLSKAIKSLKSKVFWLPSTISEGKLLKNFGYSASKNVTRSARRSAIYNLYKAIIVFEPNAKAALLGKALGKSMSAERRTCIAYLFALHIFWCCWKKHFCHFTARVLIHVKLNTANCLTPAKIMLNTQCVNFTELVPIVGLQYANMVLLQ